MEYEEFIIALIHNNEKDRLLKVIPKIDLIKLNGYKKVILQYSVQKEIKYNYIQVVKNSFIFLTTSIKFQGYLNKKKSIKFVFESMKIFINIFRYDQYKKNVKHLSIINALSLKHVNALKDLVNSTASFALILESDAEISNVHKLEDALEEIIKLFDVYKYCYAIVGDGYTIAKLGVDKIPKTSKGSVDIYELPFTNTSCSYFINRDTANLILSEMLKYPENVPYVGADWLFNFAFIGLKSAGKQIKCLIFKDGLVGNGSRLGLTESTIHDS